MAAAGFAYLIGLMFAAYALPAWGLGISLLVVILITTAVAVYSVKRREFMAVTLATICLTAAFAHYSLVYNIKLAPDLEYDGAEGEVTAFVTGLESHPSYTLYTCSLESIDGAAETGNVDFSYMGYKGIPMDEGDRFCAIMKFTAGDPVYLRENIRSDIGEGIILKAELTEGEIEVLERRDHYKNFSEKIREFFSVRMKSFMPISGSDLADAMLFGDKSSLSEGTEDNFRLSGTAHMLAISGFHLTILMGFVQVFCDFLGFGRKSRSLITSFFVLLYMFITGFPYSVVRAGTMALVMCLSQLSGRERDNFSTLSFTVLIICIFSPMAIWDLGFLLSVASMLGIVLLHEKFQEYCYIHIYNSFLPAPLRFALKAVIPPLSVGISASLTVFPLVAVIYRHFNLLSVVTSALLSFPATVLLVGALAIAVLGDLGITRIIGMAVSISAEIIKAATSFFAEIGGIGLPFSAWIFVLYFTILVAIFAFSSRYAKTKKFIAAAICCVLVMSGVFISDSCRVNNLKGVYVSVSERGESVLFVKGGKAYAIVPGSTLPYASRKFASDIGLEIVGSNLVHKESGSVYSMFGDGDGSFCKTGTGTTADVFGVEFLLNSDQRVDGAPDILIQDGHKLDRPLQATVGELTVICMDGSADKNKIMKLLPAGRNIILEPGCGVFIEFKDEITVTKYDYGY